MSRLDNEIVARGLAESRSRAQALIIEGAVRVEGIVAKKASASVAEGAEIAVAGDGWVSRGALKLLHGLDHFELSPEGAVAADIGASTGGFTQVLLARGAARVIALDVGHGQLHRALAADSRVESRHGVNARHLGSGDLPPLDWVVGDLSFISLTKALGPALEAVRPGGQLLCLVKPQFELGPGAIGKGGIVRDDSLRAEAPERVAAWLRGLGWQVQGWTDSPIAGGDGNREYLLAARAP
jgi:23S rRNA (cytidine1920-2'-O)/16S rRNA (cytidine1409-2'-O)-methyltransferase